MITTLQKITKVEWRGGYRLQLIFADGYRAEIDLQPALWGDIFKQVREVEYFKQVSCDGYTIHWANGADLCPDTLRMWCESGRVLSSEEMNVSV